VAALPTDPLDVAALDAFIEYLVRRVLKSPPTTVASRVQADTQEAAAEEHSTGNGKRSDLKAWVGSSFHRVEADRDYAAEDAAAYVLPRNDPAPATGAVKKDRAATKRAAKEVQATEGDGAKKQEKKSKPAQSDGANKKDAVSSTTAAEAKPAYTEWRNPSLTTTPATDASAPQAKASKKGSSKATPAQTSASAPAKPQSAKAATVRATSTPAQATTSTTSSKATPGQTAQAPQQRQVRRIDVVLFA
jgi:hypothetical protein